MTYWQFVKRESAEVAAWPAWKQGITRRRMDTAQQHETKRQDDPWTKDLKAAMKALTGDDVPAVLRDHALTLIVEIQSLRWQLKKGSPA